MVEPGLKIQLLRDFRRRPVFDFFNTIRRKADLALGCVAVEFAPNGHGPFSSPIRLPT